MFEFASLVDTRDLVESILASIIAALSVTTVVCIVIWGSVKHADFNQAGRTAAARGALTVSIFGMFATFGIVAFTLYLMVAAPK